VSLPIDLIGRSVLVTGASGFLGRRTVELLAKQGCAVRAFVRKTSKTGGLRLPGVVLYYGDISDAESMKPAFEGVDYVVHAAADTGGSEEGGRLVTIQGTRNVLDLCDVYGVKKLVYISSCSVYGVAAYRDGQVVDENAALETAPEQRGAYSGAKLEAEKLVTRFMAQGKIPVVCLRPGTIYGPGGPVYSPMIGFSSGSSLFAVIGAGDFELPLVYIDNLAAAVIAALTNETANGQMYNVVDTDRVTKRRYMDRVIRQLYPRSRHIYIPYALLYFLVMVQEKLFTTLQRKPVMSGYRLTSSQKPIIYDATKIVKELNWQPMVSFEEAVARLIQYEREH